MTEWADIRTGRWVGQTVALVCAVLLVAIATVGVPDTYASSGFGIERYTVAATEKDGSADTQAGSHPYELTIEAGLDPSTHSAGTEGVKSVDFELPAGLIIDPAAIAQDGVVGSVQISVAGTTKSATVYNLAPAPGELGRFGFAIEGISMGVDIAIRAGGGYGSSSGGYGMTLSIGNITQLLGVESVKLILGGTSPRLLALPTSCAGPLPTTVRGESWGAELASLSTVLPQVDDCNDLSFAPTLNMAPNITQADEPSGYRVQLSVPQNENPEGLATAQLRDAAIVFPAGVSLGPSWMEGLVGCSEAEFGLASAQRGMCPNMSKVGTVELQTLDGSAADLEGNMYMAASATPLVAPYELYVEAQGSGVLVKLAGHLAQNPATGQLTLSFEDLPQLPFSDIELTFFGGHDALLASPPACGMFTATSDLAPWSAGPQATPSASFQISTGTGGGPCPGSSSSSSSPDPVNGSSPASTDNASLTSVRIMTTRRGDAAVKLACAGTGTCRGKLTLTAATRGVKGEKKHGHASRVKTTTIGTAGFSIPAGKATTIELELNATGRALLKADHGRLSASLTILKSSPAPSQTHIESVRLVQ